ncbi:Protein SERAC1 [Pleurostoma richardsiae]|uniref:Protein SERAC1 n=1 Tax=Pleurostoma richardsiae TaxID=41990 RepID=A0AA38VU20_9PEZI|nr:Protein SERAC1 [Pleurostoma richardsiae]
MNGGRRNHRADPAPGSQDPTYAQDDSAPAQVGAPGESTQPRRPGTPAEAMEPDHARRSGGSSQADAAPTLGLGLQAPTISDDENENEKSRSNRSSYSHWDPEPGFAHVDGEIDGTGYNETKVDIITVPCPGADPVETWARDPLPDDYFGSPSDFDLHGDGHDAVKELAGDVILTPAISYHLPKAAHLWVRQGIRKSANAARVLLYRHRELTEKLDLDMLAQDLLDHVLRLRKDLNPSRPLFFIAHSIGGLVVKLALLKARQHPTYRGILYNCHGVTFFATPHRGSSYMSMTNLRESIRLLMHLQHPLPMSIADDLRLGESTLLKMHEDFAAIASDMRIWTFYETIDSLLSEGSESALTDTVQFSAPLVSIKSALVGVRQETVYSSLESGHANCASFGPQNPKTMAAYLEDLSLAVSKAVDLSQYTHTPLTLKERVKVEVIGFYEDPDAAMDSAIRLYFTKYHLADFLDKGPERCLAERLTGGPKSSPDNSPPMDGAEILSKHPAEGTVARRVAKVDLNLRILFMWIHTPFTNPPWVKSIFDKLSETHGQDFAKLFNNENWVSRHVQGRHSQSQPSFVKPACSYIPVDSASSPRTSFANSGTSVSKKPSPSYLYLYLPYLHFDTYLNVLKRRNIMRRRMKHGRAKPVPSDIADLDSLELKVIWEFLGYDPALNCRRTLDQFGYPSLKDTYARDDDQMLYKLTREDIPQQAMYFTQTRTTAGIRDGNESIGSTVKGQSVVTSARALRGQEAEKTEYENETDIDLELEVRDGNLLMVDQLWLWAIDTTTLTTFFPKRDSRPIEGPMFQQADLRNSVYNELNGDLTGRCENALDLAAFITLHAVTVLLDRSSHPDLEVFRIFEEAIGMLTERMTSNMKRFRMQSFREIIVDGSDYDDPDEMRPQSIKKRHKRELKRAERENRDNTSALLELRDLEDELTTLLRLFDTQSQVIEKMKSIYSSDTLKDITENGRVYLTEALARLEEYKAQTTEMLKRVDTTRKDYEKLLEMAQRQAQVDDVRWSRLQTELASSQNLSVMIFTTFTVIFLPLSFFTGLFGMNTLEWGGDRGKFPTIGYIGSIALPISALLIAGTLLAAFSSRVQAVFKAVFRQTRKGLVGVAQRGVVALQPADKRLARMSRKKREAWEEREYRDSKRKDKTYDFWATVRRQRGSAAYLIPDLNRKPFGRPAARKATWRSA